MLIYKHLVMVRRMFCAAKILYIKVDLWILEDWLVLEKFLR